ncbi:nuclear transport factor 2 family protein [Croceiramulus getboli]|nr:nuclear transport factor 2 family protein [Flavobacteriaceae bacterium YJPT1-3]
MRLPLLLFFSILPLFSFAQGNTEIYLAEIDPSDSTNRLSNLTNITNQPGYDSQPYFLNDDKILYAGGRQGASEIMLYDLRLKESKQYNIPTAGGEYSPQPIPESDKISAVRLDPDGLQRLYAYGPDGSEELLFDPLVVAYYLWFDEETLVASAIQEESLNMVVARTGDDSVILQQKNTGRSFHAIPQSDQISYISKENDQWTIKSLHPDSGATQVIIPTLPGKEDCVWLPDGSVLMADNTMIYRFDPKTDRAWEPWADLSSYPVQNINRLAISPDGTKIALVAEPVTSGPAQIVQRHLEPFNQGDLDRFVTAFAEEVVVRNFPEDTLYQGQDQLREYYDRFFKKNSSWKVEVTKRMVYKSVVVDEEQVTINGKTHRQATIYETANDKIQSMTFVRTQEPVPGVEQLIDDQLAAYNQGDVKAFAKTYAKDIQLFRYPNQLMAQGQATLKEIYGTLFKANPDLRVTINNRIVIGNRVIDEEQGRMNGQTFGALAIYEVDKGKIQKVTFIQ